MKKFFGLLTVLCGLSLGCEPAAPPADTTTPPSVEAPADPGDVEDADADADADDTLE